MNTIKLNTIGTPKMSAGNSGGGGSVPSSEEWIYWDVSNVSIDNNYNFRWLAHLINAENVGIRAGGDIESRLTTKWATNLNCLHSDADISDSPILMKEYMAMTLMGDGKTVKVLLEEMGFVEITKEEFYAPY